ncbi:phosphatidylserine decarboxylase precursor-related protein, partial [Alysiella filiformis DSM 16848]
MNRYYPHTIIAQEGWTFIIGGAVVSVIIMLLGGWWSLPFWLATLFMLNFFRDPARNIPEAPDAILSPADGRVVVVEKAIDPYRNVETLKISVFMNVFDVHSQRAPAKGKITDVRYTAGSKINASLDKASSENERNAILMTTTSGRDITFVQIAGLVARRILCYVNKGDSLVRGERYGFIRFGSRVDVYLPLDASPNVAIGDKVRATETILAFLPLEQDPNFDPSKVQIENKHSTSPAARLKADKIEQSQRLSSENDLDEQIRARVAAQFQQENPTAHSGSIAKEEWEVAARLAKIQAERQAERQAETPERERIIAAAAAEEEAVRQRLAQEQAEQAAKQEQARIQAEQTAKAEAQRIAAEQARIQAEQAAKAEAERIAQEQARIQAEQAAKAEAERIAQEQARIQAEQAAKAEAERIAAEQA